MQTLLERTLLWTPRVLLIAFAVFLGTFAADVFGQGLGFWMTLVALVLHLVPSLVILVPLIFVWKYEPRGGVVHMEGGALLIVMGVAYILSANGKFPATTFSVIGGPPIIIGAMFCLHWWLFRRTPPRTAPQTPA